MRGNMADKEWTVKELTEALKQFPSDAKVYYEMGPNGPRTIGRARYVKPWGEGDKMAVLLDRYPRSARVAIFVVRIADFCAFFESIGLLKESHETALASRR